MKKEMKTDKEKIIDVLFEEKERIKETAVVYAAFLNALNFITAAEMERICKRIPRFARDGKMKIDWDYFTLLKTLVTKGIKK